MTRLPIFLILCALALVGSCSKQDKKSFLSNLSADKDTPLYTTYAAAMERSEFVLDEGYEYNFYSEGSGIEFTTDTGGDICTGFVFEGNWIYNLEDYFKEPIISLSYPDMVKSYYYPVEGLRVENTFLVESSFSAIQEITLKNERLEDLSIDIVPFMKNNYRAFNNVEKLNDSTFYFTHEEFPDSWTLSHNLPYEDTIQNVFAISESPDATGSFNLLDGATTSIPWQVVPDKKSVYQLRGRTFIDGERNLELAPKTRFYAFVNKDQSQLITENSPVWENTQGSINLDGFYRAELGNLGVGVGDGYQIMMFLEEGHLVSEFTGKVGEEKSLRHDLNLAEFDKISVIQEIKIERSEEGFFLKWEKGLDLHTWIYKRVYPDEGIYNLIGQTDSSEFLDETSTDGTIGYILCHYDPVSGELGPHSREITTIDPIRFERFIEEGKTDAFARDFSKNIAFKKSINLNPGESRTFRWARSVGKQKESIELIKEKSREVMKVYFDTYIEENEKLFSQVQTPETADSDMAHLYWSSFNMMRQVFYPPEAKSSYNYYVFSREPTWGWGHGGQVFHESLTMPAYALLDPQSAMDAQRVYVERQYDNGYINYRTGSYLDEKIEFDGQLTSSAPWYNYQNWQLYQITMDKEFLKQMYGSGERFYNFYISNRDQDGDGLCEWGGHAVLESVRDALVAVWDEVGWPSNFEAVDLNSMLVMEAKSLEQMALELGLAEEAEKWRFDWTSRSKMINEVFWDDESEFYYHVDKKDNDFTFENPNDLKRQEIIGFLPLWAGVASEEQAEILIKKLRDPAKFWRKYGVPSLSADDPYYNEKGYWNGPVWVEWNYLIVQGLLDYGYEKEARELTTNVAQGMIYQLKENHNLWEFYSPDTTWAGYHKTYIWAGIINKMIWDVENYTNGG
jgi:hypothetical protein